MLVDRERGFEAVGVLRDQRVRRVEDALRGATVLDQRHDGGVGERLAERREVPERRATPRKDRLVVVADDGDVAVRRDELAEQRELRGIGVLELVYQDVAEAVLQPTRGRGMLAQETKTERDLIAEVDD